MRQYFILSLTLFGTLFGHEAEKPFKILPLWSGRGLVEHTSLESLLRRTTLSQHFVPLQSIGTSYAFLHQDIPKKWAHMTQVLHHDASIMWALCGGYGSANLAYSILETPTHLEKFLDKLVIGYSDITYLHLLAAKYQTLSLHGPMLQFHNKTPSSVNTQASLNHVMHLLKGDATRYTLSLIKNTLKAPLHGLLVGGNLSIISRCMGTPLHLDVRHKILLLEDVTLSWKVLWDLLLQLYHGGYFHQAHAVVFGEILLSDTTLKQEAIIKKIFMTYPFSQVNIPIFYRKDFGHGARMSPLWLGHITQITKTCHNHTKVYYMNQKGVVRWKKS